MMENLGPLKKKFSAQATKVEESVEKAINGLLQGDTGLFQKVRELEKEINALHVDIDGDCFKYIALKQPVARELRFVLACLKANTDLERIADQAINITETGQHLLKNSSPILPEIREMTKQVLSMVQESVDCFIKLDFKLAHSVFRRENAVDQMKKDIFLKVISEGGQNINVETAMEFILISRNLERIGDHAVNIAEYLFFLEEGKDVRHTQFLNGGELSYASQSKT